jgi:hypothetical protein
VIGQTIIFLLVYFNHLAMIAFLVAEYHIGRIGIFYKYTLNGKELLIMQYILGVNHIKVAFAKRKIMYGVEQVGFAHTIASHKTIDLVREVQFYGRIILKIGKKEFLQIHGYSLIGRESRKQRIAA